MEAEKAHGVFDDRSVFAGAGEDDEWALADFDGDAGGDEDAIVPEGENEGGGAFAERKCRFVLVNDFELERAMEDVHEHPRTGTEDTGEECSANF